jgi:hypothetical protein
MMQQLARLAFVQPASGFILVGLRTPDSGGVGSEFGGKKVRRWILPGRE